MKHAKIIRKLSLAYWEVYSRKLRLAATANDWQKAGGKKASRPTTPETSAAWTTRGLLPSFTRL